MTSRPWRARAGRMLITLFIAYHVTVLLVANLPAQGPTKGLHWIFTRHARMALYFEAVGIYQNWNFFSPNPPRANTYVRVLVRDASGGVTDTGHDSQGRQAYPYLWYDHMRKVNRRLGDEREYQPSYAAWVCRTWERTHGGHPAVEVRFVRISTRIPAPSADRATPGYDPLALPVEESPAGRHLCAALPDGRLPPYLRRRYGLPVPAAFERAAVLTWQDRPE